jgi:molybdenum cofactor biosynthesis enzyme MoaA
MAKSNKSNFCIRPFNSVVVSTSGAFKVCCKIQNNKENFNLKKNKLQYWWKSDYIKKLRKNFLINKKPKECKSCWDDEAQGLISFRIRSNTEYKAIFQNNYNRNLKLIKKDNLQYPEDVEINITNLCNLKCQMCTGKDSSRLLVENKILGFEDLKQGDYELTENDYFEIQEIIQHDISLLNLRGGEPLFNKKIIKLIELLIKNGKAKTTKLHITTNGTICNNKILNLLSHFEYVRIMFSVESVGIYNNYLRYPSNWGEIEKNILRFKNLKNTYMYINTVVQNLNILYLQPLIEFAYKNGIFIKFEKLKNPEYLELTNLPLDLLKKSYERINIIDKKKLIHTENINEILSFLKINIESYKFDKIKFDLFADMIKKRDKFRKISIADYMPEIYNII